MAKKKQLKKKKTGNGCKKCSGRPSPCSNPPGETACLKNMENNAKKKRLSCICRQCNAPEVKQMVKRMFFNMSTNTERSEKMKFLWIMGICLVLLAVFALRDSYKYPVCPKCHDNLRSKRVKGKIVCQIHGVVCILLFFCGASFGNTQEISNVKKISNTLPDFHILVKLAPDINIYMVTAINGCHINILAKRLGINPIV